MLSDLLIPYNISNKGVKAEIIFPNYLIWLGTIGFCREIITHQKIEFNPSLTGREQDHLGETPTVVTQCMHRDQWALSARKVEAGQLELVLFPLFNLLIYPLQPAPRCPPALNSSYLCRGSVSFIYNYVIVIWGGF